MVIIIFFIVSLVLFNQDNSIIIYHILIVFLENITNTATRKVNNGFKLKASLNYIFIDDKIKAHGK